MVVPSKIFAAELLQVGDVINYGHNDNEIVTKRYLKMGGR